MAVQDPRLAGYGVRPLTDEQIALRDARQAAYQQQLAQRQATQAQQFQQTQQAGLANQAGRPFVEPPVEQFSPQQLQTAGTAMQGVADRAVANALPPSPTLGVQGVAAPAQPAVTGAAPAAPTQQATTLSPEILADANQRIAQTLAANRPAAPAVTPERGNYNMQNVDQAALAQRAAPTAGISGLGQFGGQSAGDYLANARAQDQADTARRQQSGAEARIGLERSALQRAATQGTGNDRLAARRALGAFETQQLQATQEAGATGRVGMEVAARQEQARQQAAASVLAAQAQAQGQLGAAQLRGQYGLQEAELTGQLGVEAATRRAAGAVQAAQAGADPLKEQRAELLATRLRQLNAKIAAGTATDEDFLDFTATTAAQRDQSFQNPITGAPLSPAEIQAEQQRNLQRLQQTR